MPSQKDLKHSKRRLTIRHCESSPKTGSWKDAISHIKAKKVEQVHAQMKARQEALSKAGQLRFPDHFNTEGILPDGKSFYAIKVGKIRAYGWFSDGEFWISHYAFKDSRKLGKDDTARVIKNWREQEGS